MSHSKGKLHKARFCPWCGLEKIERDNFHNNPDSHVEFVCTMCGVGFRLLESTRRQAAITEFARIRKLRVSDRQSINEAEDRYKALCHKKWKQFRSQQREVASRVTGELMKAWLESEEAKMARGW